MTYRMNVGNLPSCSNDKLSIEKAEKVVNPPQKPVIRNSLISGENWDHRPLAPNKHPMIRQPVTFTKKVP